VTEESSISILIPFTVGFSVNDYYVNSAGEEDAVGFWDLGLNASYGVPLPVRFGGWSINGGEGSEIVGSVGLGWS